MQTLLYGFQLPDTGDKGTTLFNGLAQNITQLNSHTHDGINSAPISAGAIQSSQGIISSGNWVASGGPVGEYKQLVNIPGGFTFDGNTMSFRLNGDYVYPRLQKMSESVFAIYTNDPTVNYQVVYGG